MNNEKIDLANIRVGKRRFIHFIEENGKLYPYLNENGTMTITTRKV